MQNSPLKMRTAPVEALLQEPKPDDLSDGLSRTARPASAGLVQSSTVVVQLLADGPDSVQCEAREASVGVLPLVAQETVSPGGGVGMATQPVVSYAPVVVL